MLDSDWKDFVFEEVHIYVDLTRFTSSTMNLNLCVIK